MRSHRPRDDEAAPADTADNEAAALAEQKRSEVAAAAAARGHRRQARSALVGLQPTNAELLKVLVLQYLSGVAARSHTTAVTALLRDWDASAEGFGEKARNAKAWHRAIAAAELHTSELKDNTWDHKPRPPISNCSSIGSATNRRMGTRPPRHRPRVMQPASPKSPAPP